MNENAQAFHDATFETLVEKAAEYELSDPATTTVMKNLQLFSASRPPAPAPETETTPVPVTKWSKFKTGAAKVLDNETTRVAIKAVGSVAGVGLVVWTTIHKDHVMERNALAQANQRPI